MSIILFTCQFLAVATPCIVLWYFWPPKVEKCLKMEKANNFLYYVIRNISLEISKVTLPLKGVFSYISLDVLMLL